MKQPINFIHYPNRRRRNHGTWWQYVLAALIGIALASWTLVLVFGQQLNELKK